MGDIAEMYQEQEYLYDWEDREEEYASFGIWPSKSGEIKVEKMTDDHLSHALKWIEKHNLNSPLQDMLEREIERRKTSKTFESKISAWAIRQKSTGFYLPARKNGRGYSFDEPTNDCFPRLFKSKLSATRALSAWLQGNWTRSYHTREVAGWPEDIEYITNEKVEGRNRDDMEIVEFVLQEVTK